MYVPTIHEKLNFLHPLKYFNIRLYTNALFKTLSRKFTINNPTQNTKTLLKNQ